MSYCRDLVIKKLPDQNYVVLKFLVEFLSLVRLKFIKYITRAIQLFVCPLTSLLSRWLTVVI